MRIPGVSLHISLLSPGHFYLCLLCLVHGDGVVDLACDALKLRLVFLLGLFPGTVLVLRKVFTLL